MDQAHTLSLFFVSSKAKSIGISVVGATVVSRRGGSGGGDEVSSSGPCEERGGSGGGSVDI